MKLQWDAQGKLAMTVEPAPSPPGGDACASTGQEVLKLFLIAGKGEDRDRKDLQIAFLRPDAREPVKLDTNAMDGTDIVARGEKNLKLWKRGISIGTVSACDHRALVVSHAGKQAALAADGTPSPALEGTPLGGQWELRSALTATEQRVPSARPKRLALVATLRCTNGEER